ncbi:hypothetical protein ACHAWF_016179 [Thalassiosira exigua]
MGVSPANDIESLPHPSEWPHRPVCLVGCEQVNKNNEQTGSLPVGKPVPVDTDLFKGCFSLRLRHVDPPADDAEKHEAYFGERKRLYQMVIQGQFKKEGLTFKDMIMGDVYERPFQGVPHGWIGTLLKASVETLSPGLVFDIFDDTQPKVLAPMGGCQTLRVDLPGQEPTDFNEIIEDTSLLGEFDSIATRRTQLGNPIYAEEYKIDTDHVYTFEVYDDMMDFGTFHQHVRILGGMKVDLVPVLDSQSMSFGMYTRDDMNCAFNFSLWHERIIEQQAISKEEKDV